MALMYRHRPAFPALAGAIATLLIGVFCFALVYQRVQSGEIGHEKLAALTLLSISISGICLSRHLPAIDLPTFG